MEHAPILTELLIILLVTAPIVFLFQKLKLPSIVGLFVAGVILGPSLTGWVSDKEHIEVFAEIGVVLLLFTIGLEFSFSNLKQLRKQMLVGGSLQLFLTGGSVFLITYYFGWSPKEALIFGFFVSLSSTAIVFKLLMDRGGDPLTPRSFCHRNFVVSRFVCGPHAYYYSSVGAWRAASSS